MAWTARRLRLPCLLLVPLAVLAAAPEGATQELEGVQREREAAQARLAELTEQIAVGGEELGRLGGELRSLDAGVARAQAAEDAARRRSEAAAEQVAEVETRVAEIEALLAERNGELTERAVQLYMQGAARGSGVLALEGEADFLDRLPYLEALALSDAVLVQDTEAVRAVVQAAQERLTQLRADAQEQQDLAREATLSIEGLRERQRQVLDAAQAEQGRRTDLLNALEQDAEAREELIRRLEAQARALGPRVEAGVDPVWMANLPPAGQQWGPSISRAAATVGLDPRLLAALVWTESSFRPNVVSPSGAIGLSQLLPSTAELLGVDPYDPEQNLDGGALYLAQMLERFDGRVEFAIAAYNAGPGEVEDADGIPPFAETQLYVTRVLGHYEELSR